MNEESDTMWWSMFNSTYAALAGIPVNEQRDASIEISKLPFYTKQTATVVARVYFFFNKVRDMKNENDQVAAFHEHFKEETQVKNKSVYLRYFLQMKNVLQGSR